jgi:hypothetical protein
MIRSILVARNKLKPFRKLSLPVYQGRDRGGSLSGFFYCPKGIGLHPLVRPHVRGCVEEKRITLTQGGRVHEGSAPSDKRVNKLMCECRTLQPDPINKAAEHIKGRPPMWTPTGEGSYICVIYTHHRYRSPCIV